MATSSGDVKLSESTRDALHEQLQIQNAREQDVQASFEAVFADLDDQIELTWAKFRDGLLYPLVSELGARTYELISGASININQAGSHLRFLNPIPVSLRGPVSDRIAAFFYAPNRKVRGYVLSVLNAAFLVQATHLSDKTLDFVVARNGPPLRLNVFVDTNFLFSLIGIHANPADDVVEALHHLIDALKGRLNIKLYVLPITVDEAKRTISGYEQRLSGLYLTKGMSQAAKDGTQDLSGITLKFIEESIKTGKRLSATEYFSPYHENLLQVARSKGVELYNKSTDSLRTDQDVIDDVLAQMEFEKARKPERRRKSYEKVLHDMVLWHFTRRQRPVRLESPIAAEFWVATIDFGLLGYDRHKRSGHAGEPPVCIHPTVLLQLLQFWVPQNELLEAALVTSLQPLLPHEFDGKAEDVTIRILRSLSRFEGAENIGQDTVAHILFDSAVRLRVGAASNVEEEIEVVHAAIANENRRLEQDVKELEREASGLQSDVRVGTNEKQMLQEALNDQQAENRSVQDALAAERDSRRQLEDRLRNIEQRGRYRRACLWVGAAASMGTIVLALAGWIGLTFVDMPTPVLWTGIGIFAVAGGLAGSVAGTYLNGPILSSMEWPNCLRRVTVGYWSLVVIGLAIELLGGWLSGLLTD